MQAAKSLVNRTAHRAFHASASRSKIHNNVLETIGNTPVIRINKLAPNGVNVFVKAEYFNPLSSVKDRLAHAVIADAERRGALKPGQMVIEATSGNTGIALAMVCAQKGYPCVLTMVETFSVERRKIMRALGAKVVLTPAKDRGYGMVKKAEELAKKHNAFLANQFVNEANPAYHAVTTGPEIVRDFSDIGLDYWVTGYGTGGTLQGAGKILRQSFPKCKIVVAEPEEAALLFSGKPQARNDDSTAAKPHEAFSPHPIQGWTPDFIPHIVDTARDLKLIDQIVKTPGAAAKDTSQLLMKKEGIFTGLSGGASMWAALEVAKTAPKGSNILTMLPDTAERYLSTPLFAGITDAMNAEEQSLAESTPNYILPAAPKA